MYHCSAIHLLNQNWPPPLPTAALSGLNLIIHAPRSRERKTSSYWSPRLVDRPSAQRGRRGRKEKPEHDREKGWISKFRFQDDVNRAQNQRVWPQNTSNAWLSVLKSHFPAHRAAFKYYLYYLNITESDITLTVTFILIIILSALIAAGAMTH